MTLALPRFMPILRILILPAALAAFFVSLVATPRVRADGGNTITFTAPPPAPSGHITSLPPTEGVATNALTTSGASDAARLSGLVQDPGACAGLSSQTGGPAPVLVAVAGDASTLEVRDASGHVWRMTLIPATAPADSERQSDPPPPAAAVCQFP